MKLTFIFIFGCISMHSYCAVNLDRKNYLDFNSINLKDKSYIIDNKYSDINFSSKGIAKDQMEAVQLFQILIIVFHILLIIRSWLKY